MADIFKYLQFKYTDVVDWSSDSNDYIIWSGLEQKAFFDTRPIFEGIVEKQFKGSDWNNEPVLCQTWIWQQYSINFQCNEHALTGINQMKYCQNITIVTKDNLTFVVDNSDPEYFDLIAEKIGDTQFRNVTIKFRADRYIIDKTDINRYSINDLNSIEVFCNNPGFDTIYQTPFVFLKDINTNEKADDKTGLKITSQVIQMKWLKMRLYCNETVKNQLKYYIPISEITATSGTNIFTSVEFASLDVSQVAKNLYEITLQMKYEIPSVVYPLE